MNLYLSYDDITLFEKLSLGDEAAFTEIYNRWFEKAYSAAFKRLQDIKLAEDVTQDFFLTLWNKRSKLNIQNPSAYLYTAIRNSVFNILLKEKRFVPLEQKMLNQLKDPLQSDVNVMRQELILSYEKLVSSLPKGQHKIFRMRFEEDMNTDEIAEKLQLTRKTVQNQILNSLKKIRGLKMLFWGLF